jgi:hypothetical protein
MIKLLVLHNPKLIKICFLTNSELKAYECWLLKEIAMCLMTLAWNVVKTLEADLRDLVAFDNGF